MPFSTIFYPFFCIIQLWFPCPFDHFLFVLHCVIRHPVKISLHVGLDRFNCYQWRIQEFQNRGHGPCTDEFLRSANDLMPFHMFYDFVVRVEEKLHIVALHVDCNESICVLIFKQGVACPVRWSWICLWLHVKFMLLRSTCSNFYEANWIGIFDNLNIHKLSSSF